MNFRRILLPALAAIAVLAGLAWYLASPARSTPALAEKKQNSLAVSSSTESAKSVEPLLPLPEQPALNPAKVSLGRQLFHDTRLSRDNRTSCASCHVLDRGGADGRALPAGSHRVQEAVNTPSVLTAALNFRQFWDGRAATLEAQLEESISSPKEMASDWPTAVANLEADPKMKEAFQQLYPNGVTSASIANAIAEFERSLPRPSRFDRWLRGNSKAISEDEQAGYLLFKKHGCIGCHQGANVGGNLFQSFGIMSQYYSRKGTMNPAEPGRYNTAGQEEDRNLLKVPSLRNVALTAPYFHDGSVERLEDAVAIMGHYQLGINLPHEDIQLIVVFLQSLNSEVRP